MQPLHGAVAAYTERCDNMFLFGALIGFVVATMSMTLIAAITIEEKEKQIDYFKRQLQEQAAAERCENYGY